MPEPEIWVLIADDGTVSAYDTQDQAITAAVDQTQPWIECVTLNRPQEATSGPLSDFQPTQPTIEPTIHETGTRRRTWLQPPSLTIRGQWVSPYDGGAA